ncbi:MAG: response regulator [Bacteroidetes bacterium]|nr:response regulator [Bacteroidota bacterium]
MLKKITILILDTELNSCEEKQEFLQNKGYCVFTANTLRQGLSTLKTQEIDLLILDSGTTGKNGIVLLREVKKLYPRLEVILLSFQADMESVTKALRLGALDYIRKPFTFVDFQIAILRTLKFVELKRKIEAMEERNLLLSGSPEEKIDLHLKREIRGETLTTQDKEMLLLRKALKEKSFNQKAAAEVLGISRDALIRRMKKYNIRIKKED